MLVGGCGAEAAFPDEAAQASAAAPAIAGPLAIGTNLDGLAFWSPAMPIADVVKSAGAWLPQSDAVYDTREAVPLDEHGWVRALPAPGGGSIHTRVNLNILHDNPAARPSARYVVLFDGQGSLQLVEIGGARVIASKPGRLVVESTSNGGLYFKITATDPDSRGDHLRNIRVVREDRLAAYRSGSLFNDDFIARIEPFGTVRFMDWMQSNTLFDRAGQPITEDAKIRAAPPLNWSDRARMDDMRWADGSRGVPVEAMVALANQIGADPWFNMPVNASDDYVRGFASYVKQNLRADLKVSVELSNEVWNLIFPQARYAETRAREQLGVNAKWVEWYGKRSAEVGMIWNSVFDEPVKRRADPGRIRVVFATQFGHRGLEEFGLETVHWRDSNGVRRRAADYFDDYAITGYYDGTMNSDAVASRVIGWWRDPDGGYQRAIDALRARIADHNAPGYAYHGGVARNYGLRLITYESGFGEYTPISQHQNQAYTDFLRNLQRRPEFHDLETRNYRAFHAAGGKLYMNFGTIGTPGKWGNWSVLESVDQTTTPRYRALTDWIAANPVKPPLPAP